MMKNTNTLLLPEVMAPGRRERVWSFVPVVATSLFAATVLAAGAAAMLLAPGHGARHITVHVPAAPVTVAVVPAPTPAPAPMPVAAEPAEPASEPQPPAPVPAPAQPTVTPRNGDYALVFELGGRTYASIDRLVIPESHQGDIEAALPPHGAYSYFGDEYNAGGASATLEREYLPADISAWLGREVIIDGQCHARVSELAVVALVSGSYDYMGEPGADTSRAQYVFEQGALYLAAELTGCSSERGIARLASLPASVPATVVHDDKLIERAKARLFASAYAKDAQRAYTEASYEGDFWRDQYAEIQGQVVRHPVTGQTLISIHAVVDYGCGGADINLWALYRVTDKGALENVRVLSGTGIMSLSTPVDLDGDGVFEFPGTVYMGDTAILSMDGETLRTLEVPFYGCPC